MSLPSKMARKKESPQKAVMREMTHDYLKHNDISIKSKTDVNFVMCDMMYVLLKGNWRKTSGYSKYDYRNKDTSNSWNGHSRRPCIPAMGIFSILRDRNGEYDPQLIKKYQNTIIQDMNISDSTKFWLSIMNGLKYRSVEDILITCVDGLTGFPQAHAFCIIVNLEHFHPYLLYYR